MKILVVNADDFGFNRDVNAGIVEAHVNGILTSTTLMANGDAFQEAVQLAFDNPSLDIGVHLALVQGRSLLTGDKLPKGPRELLLALATRQIDPYAELRVQIEKVIATGLPITHLDTHKHTHIVPGVFRSVVRLAKEFGIPWVRLPIDYTVPGLKIIRPWYSSMAAGVHVTQHFLGFRLTGKLTEDTLTNALPSVPDGITELMVHPGILGPELATAPTRLKQSRALELQALTSPRIRELLTKYDIHLRPFSAARD